MLRRNFTRFDMKKNGLVNETNFIEALDCTNPDFMQSSEGIEMVDIMFKGDLSMRKINYEKFMSAMFARNVDAVEAIFAL
jgi:hypothetical protein